MPGKLEGFGWYTHEIVRRMVLNHPEDQFYFLFDRAFDPRFVYASNVTPLVLFPPARHAFLWYWWFGFSVPKVLKKNKVDVFFSPDSYLSLNTDTPTVMTTHDLAPLHHPQSIPFFTRKYYLRYLPRFLRRADHVLTVSEYVRQDILLTCGLQPDKVSVAYNGCRKGFVPLSGAEQQSVREQYAAGQDYFFYTGAIHPRKNIPRLIRAFEQFKQQTGASTKLLLAGRLAWQTEEVQQALEQSPFREDIQVLGYVPEPELPRLMAAARALVYISLNEGFGLPILEAMHCEVPVIAANTTALPEVAGDAALLVDPLSETSVAQAMCDLYKHPDLAAALVTKGRLQRQQFSWDLTAEKVYAVLKATAQQT